MIKVFENLYIGNERDCFHEVKRDWVVIHACKSPCHQRKVGYKGSLPSTHPEYLTSEEENHLYLNMVDMPQPLSPKYTNPIVERAMSFIEKNISSKNVLIHCNLGKSRAPSLALIYLVNKRFIATDSFESAVRAFKELYPYSPATGISAYIRNNWAYITNLISGKEEPEKT